MDKPVFAGNSDTGLLKTVAFITMLADHVGYLFFSDEIIWRLIGRISFPLFAYCLVLGFLHTKDVKKYFIRLGAFSLISQLPYTFCFYPEKLGLNTENIVLESDRAFSLFGFQLNIGFTMMLGLLGIFGLDRKKYYLTALAVILSFIPAVEYGSYGVMFMIIAYLFAFSERAMFGFALAVSLGSPAFGLFINGYFDPQCFAAFAVLLMICKTDSKIKIPRWLGYGFYPAHLFILAFLNFVI